MHPPALGVEEEVREGEGDRVGLGVALKEVEVDTDVEVEEEGTAEEVRENNTTWEDLVGRAVTEVDMEKEGEADGLPEMTDVPVLEVDPERVGAGGAVFIKGKGMSWALDSTDLEEEPLIEGEALVVVVGN